MTYNDYHGVEALTHLHFFMDEQLSNFIRVIYSSKMNTEEKENTPIS